MERRSVPLLLHVVPEDPEPIRDQIVRQIRDRVVRGELGTGESLPPHRRLARQHRVSPSTVRAAYRVLVEEGFLAGEPGDGIRVAELGTEHRRDLVERLQLEKLVARELGKRELEMARDVQRRLLPPPRVSGPGWDVIARCQPARIVAGDFYDVLPQADGSVDLVVADVAGKGFAASLIMASTKAMLPFVTGEGGVADSLSELNRRLVGELGRGEFVALAMARYRPATGTVEVASAGAPDPYRFGADGRPEAVALTGPRYPLGVRPDVRYAATRLGLGPGETLLLLTDGLPEARDAAGDPLGYEALEAIAADVWGRGVEPAARLAQLFDRVQRRSGRLPEDDWTAAQLVPRDSRRTS